MSWASNDVEGYEEVLRSGVAARIRSLLKSQGFDNMDDDTIDAVVDALQTDEPKAFDALVAASSREVSDAEANYLLRSVDEENFNPPTVNNEVV